MISDSSSELRRQDVGSWREKACRALIVSNLKQYPKKWFMDGWLAVGRYARETAAEWNCYLNVTVGEEEANNGPQICLMSQKTYIFFYDLFFVLTRAFLALGRRESLARLRRLLVMDSNKGKKDLSQIKQPKTYCCFYCLASNTLAWAKAKNSTFTTTFSLLSIEFLFSSLRFALTKS